ncbi:endolytic transglycosylase MltG [uncultured Hymenobacter sp.]|uniref:endolytic transglycosylase MltG n=1 Tax=uncultured Hymenobacter sp. TaxID=170016 RepID=UPI0035CC810D
MRRWLLPLLFLLSAGTYGTWRLLYRPAPTPSPDGDAYLYIRTGAPFRAVLDSLNGPALLRDSVGFRWLAEWRGYPGRIRAGRYRLSPELGNLALLRRLENGEQDTIELAVKPFHYLPALPRRVAPHLEIDSVQLQKLLADNAGLRARYGLDTATVRTLFIPGTYDLVWNTSPRALLDTFAARHRRFWTPQRRARADSLKMSPVQVSILASIVQRETAQPTDKPLIAAVYLNRLRRGQPLQADPTLLWPQHALGTRRRVLNLDKKVDSPYNTYRHKGLPPGPITTPLPGSLDAVLQPARNQNLFFCARPDGSGFSDFAETYAQHRRNARRYQHRLDSLGVRR